MFYNTIHLVCTRVIRGRIIIFYNKIYIFFFADDFIQIETE